MLNPEKRIDKILKENNLSKSQIKDFKRVHSQGFVENSAFLNECSKMKKEELEEVVSGMITVYKLSSNSSSKEYPVNPLANALLMNMMHKIDENNKN